MVQFKKTDIPLVLSQLETLASKLGIKLRYENLKDPNFYIEGGACRIGEEKHIIVHSKLADEDKIDIIVKELRQLPLDDVYLSPLLRKLFYGDEGLIPEEGE